MKKDNKALNALYQELNKVLNSPENLALKKNLVDDMLIYGQAGYKADETGITPLTQEQLEEMKYNKQHDLFMHSQVPEIEPEETTELHEDYNGVPMLEAKFKEPGHEAYDGPQIQYINPAPLPDLFEGDGYAGQRHQGITGAEVSNLINMYMPNPDTSHLTEAGKKHLEEMQRGIYNHYEAPKKQRCYIGIDNGVSGSVGIIREDGTYSFVKTPVRSELNYTKEKAMITRIKPVDLTKLLSEAGPGSMVMIERPMVNPKMFKASTSALRAFEATIVVLETLGLAYEVCDSKEWQRGTLPKGVSGDALKPASMDVGNRLYPDAQSVKHPDRDGMLIAHFCKIKHR